MTVNDFKSKINKQLWDDVAVIAKLVVDFAGLAGMAATCFYGMNIISKATKEKWCLWDWTKPQ